MTKTVTLASKVARVRYQFPWFVAEIIIFQAAFPAVFPCLENPHIHVTGRGEMPRILPSPSLARSGESLGPTFWGVQLVGGWATPPKNMTNRQLGWHSQYVAKIIQMWKKQPTRSIWFTMFDSQPYFMREYLGYDSGGKVPSQDAFGSVGIVIVVGMLVEMIIGNNG